MTTNHNKRQYLRHILVDLGVGNVGAGNGVEASLPQGAYLLSCGIHTITAFNAATTNTGTVSDGTTTFVNAQDTGSTGVETSTGTPKFYPTGGKLTWSLASTGAAATAGRALGFASYLQLDVEDEIRD